MRLTCWIKKKHPGWTPAMIRSALMTTARTVDNMDHDILDNGVTSGSVDATVATPLAAGAGYVRPRLALDPDLVYDASEHEYVDFFCTLNYHAMDMREFDPDFVECTRTLPSGPAGLNYPSFVVLFDNRTDVRTLTRTFKKQNERKSYPVEFDQELGGREEMRRPDGASGTSAGRTRTIASGARWPSELMEASGDLQ